MLAQIETVPMKRQRIFELLIQLAQKGGIAFVVVYDIKAAKIQRGNFISFLCIFFFFPLFSPLISIIENFV